MVYQAQKDRGEDDIINKFNNLLNKVGSKPPEKMVFDMQTQFNPMTNEMGAQTDNPIFNSSSNIEIVRKPDLSNQTLLENINTPPIDDIELKVNEPDENEIAKFVNEADLMAVADEESNNYREVIKVIQPKKAPKKKTIILEAISDSEEEIIVRKEKPKKAQPVLNNNVEKKNDIFLIK